MRVRYTDYAKRELRLLKPSSEGSGRIVRGRDGRQKWEVYWDRRVSPEYLTYEFVEKIPEPTIIDISRCPILIEVLSSDGGVENR